MAISKSNLGKEGEAIAIKFLQKRGYKIIKKNYRNRLGEIDIVAKDNQTICFIEVKLRKSMEMGMPLEAINKAKQKKISQVALLYVQENNLEDEDARFDAVSILGQDEGSYEMELITNAFELC